MEYFIITNKGSFFFRFPRDEFWEKTIVKDYQFAKYINGKTSFRTVELILKENNGRPFSMHKKIEGTPLATRMNDMSEKDIKKVSKQIAKFMHEMHNLEYDPKEIFSVDNIGLELQDFITELLTRHVSKEDQKFWEGFGGFGSKYQDISRIIGRCPEEFKKEIVSSYEELEKKELNERK